MADDLEAFLRQAAQRRAQRQTTAPRPAAPARPPVSAPRHPHRAAPLTPAPPPQPLPSKVVPAQVVPTAEASRVGTRVDTAEFEQRAEHLGEEVGLADEHMEAHIAQKFDHQVGSLELGDSAQAGAGSSRPRLSMSADLVAMLKNPKTLRQAVLLSEILNPPHFYQVRVASWPSSRLLREKPGSGGLAPGSWGRACAAI